MTQQRFDHVVSLGGSCKGAYEARAHFNFGEAYPFDWWISRADALARYLRDPDPLALYAQENLEVRPAGLHVASTTHDFRFQHEFPRKWDKLGHPVAEDWQDAILPALERHRALLRRFMALDKHGRRILFIRTCEQDGDTAAIAPLLATLELRFPQTSWQLLVINPADPFEDDPRILTAHFKLAELEWTGFASAPWTAAFDGLGIRMAPGQQPFIRAMRAELDS